MSEARLRGLSKMVKLHIAARVIDEQVYLRSVDLGVPDNRRLEGEKRLKVIVPTPETWHIGTLALKVKEQFERLYQRDFGELKYLKDDTDDCDLDPEQLVSEVFVDEGAAERHGHDQHVTFKVIREDKAQNYGVRTGSVVPDLNRPQYQQPVRPPVPRFEDISSTLGKRSLDVDPFQAIGIKRVRAAEIPESQLDDRVVASIEDEEVQGSPELVQDTQNSQFRRIREEHANGRPTSTEHALLYAQDQQHEPQRELHAQRNAAPIPASRQNHLAGPRLPFTPPSEPSARHSTVRQPASSNARTISGSPLPQASTTSKRFKHTTPRHAEADLNSDIEDSQMSPGSRKVSLPTPKLVNKNYKRSSLQSIEDQADEALLPQIRTPSNQTQGLISNERSSRAVVTQNGGQQSSEESEEEDEDTDARQNGGNPAESFSQDREVTPVEDRPVQESASVQQPGGKSMVDVPVAGHDQSSSEDEAEDDTVEERMLPETGMQDRRKLTSNAEDSSSNGSSRANAVTKPIANTALPNSKQGKRKRTASLDSPGEQLSQTLQESARKEPKSTNIPADKEGEASPEDDSNDEAEDSAQIQRGPQLAVLAKKAKKQSSDATQAQQIVDRACDSCRKSKNKCDRRFGKDPCTRCQIANRSCVMSLTPLIRTSQSPVLVAKESTPATKPPASTTTKKLKSSSNKPAAQAVENRDSLHVPPPSFEREQSLVSDTSESRRTVLPVGMTQEEYDRQVEKFEAQQGSGTKLSTNARKKLGGTLAETQKLASKPPPAAKGAVLIPPLSKSSSNPHVCIVSPEDKSSSSDKGQSSISTQTPKNESAKIAKDSTKAKSTATSTTPAPTPSTNVRKGANIKDLTGKLAVKSTPAKTPTVPASQRTSVKKTTVATTVTSAKTMAEMLKAVEDDRKRNAPKSRGKKTSVQVPMLFSNQSASDDDSEDDDDTGSEDDSTVKPKTKLVNLVAPDPTIRDRSVEDDDDDEE